MYLHILPIFSGYCIFRLKSTDPANLGIFPKMSLYLTKKIRKYIIQTSFIKRPGSSLPEVIPTNIVTKFKYCPVISVDVEKSFSNYKNILSDRRYNLTTEHLEQLVFLSESTK